MSGSGLPKVSIIVPIHPGLHSAHNLKDWISNFPKSGIAEVIAVFDGPNDHVQKYMQEELISGKPIRILNVDFGNPGETRNRGLEEARGEWIAFWDSDDIGYLDSLISELNQVEDGIELIIGRAELSSLGGSELILESDPKEVVFNPGIWRYIFKRESLSGTRFPALSSGEDQVFLARYGYLERNAIHSGRVLYKYFIGSESQLTRNQSKLVDAKTAATLVMEASFLSNKWNSSYSTMSARLLTSYLKRGPGSFMDRAKNVLQAILSYRDPSFVFSLIRTWIYSGKRGIR